MNEQGLSFDINALAAARVNGHPERQPYPAGFDFTSYFLLRYSLVSEIIAFYSQFSQGFDWTIRWQIHWADATGDAVVISADPNTGEWAFTRKSNGNYLVSTNWNRALPPDVFSPCWRYNAAIAMLGNITSEDDLTVEAFRDVLNATHQEGAYPTLYSNVFDLVNREIYLYYYHNYQEERKLNLSEELAKGLNDYRIAELFGEEEPSSSPGSDSSINLSSVSRSLSSLLTSTSASTAGFPLLITAIMIILNGIVVAKRRRSKITAKRK